MSQLAAALATLKTLAIEPVTQVTQQTPKHIALQTQALRIKVYAEMCWNHNCKVTCKNVQGHWVVTAHKPEMALAIEQYYNVLAELTSESNVSMEVVGKNLKWTVKAY